MYGFDVLVGVVLYWVVLGRLSGVFFSFEVFLLFEWWIKWIFLGLEVISKGWFLKEVLIEEEV